MNNISLANIRGSLKKQAYFIYVLAATSLVVLLLPWIFYRQTEAAVPYHRGSRFWQWGDKIYYFFTKNDTTRMESKAFTKIIWDLLKKVYKV